MYKTMNRKSFQRYWLYILWSDFIVAGRRGDREPPTFDKNLTTLLLFMRHFRIKNFKNNLDFFEVRVEFIVITKIFDLYSLLF